MGNATPMPSISFRPVPRQLPKTQRQTRLSKRESWLRKIDTAHLLHHFFNLFPSLLFFAKNKEGELMLMSPNLRQLCHIQHDADVVGLTDFDLSPTRMAESFVADDKLIHSTGVALTNRVELSFDETGMPNWSVVNKFPVRSRKGEIIGVMGFSQSYKLRENLLPLHGIAKAVDYVRAHYQEPIGTSDLARCAGMSLRQLERKFNATFGIGPHKFIVKTRLLAACRALRDTELNAGEIAVACGFSDQSAFTLHFRENLGLTPRRYRVQIRKAIIT